MFAYFNPTALSHSQTELFRSLVEGKVVWDLFCGSGLLAAFAARLGATKVVGIDKADWPGWHRYRSLENLDLVRAYLDGYDPDPDVADVSVLSWPPNSPVSIPGLRRYLARSGQIIYFGQNDGCTQCGTPELWAHFLHRELMHIEGVSYSDMLVYGTYIPEGREPEHPQEVQAVKDWAIITR